MKKIYKNLEKKIKIKFKNKDILIQSLTHIKVTIINKTIMKK